MDGNKGDAFVFHAVADFCSAAGFLAKFFPSFCKACVLEYKLTTGGLLGFHLAVFEPLPDFVPAFVLWLCQGLSSGRGGIGSQFSLFSDFRPKVEKFSLPSPCKAEDFPVPSCQALEFVVQGCRAEMFLCPRCQAEEFSFQAAIPGCQAEEFEEVLVRKPEPSLDFCCHADEFQAVKFRVEEKFGRFAGCPTTEVGCLLGRPWGN